MKTIIATVALSAFLTLGATSQAEAAAQTKTSCTITRIQYDGGRFVVWCANDAQLYYGSNWQIGTGCPTQTMDTVKMWLSMFQTALLSGRLVDFNFENACGPMAINWVQLR
jgi:hypothetical protein